jgi:MFS family permease
MEPAFSVSPLVDGASREESQSAVSWGAVVAGAVAALALSLVLVALAAGFGLQVVSPWPSASPSTDDFTPILGCGMIVVQVLACALGGYLAGRLRTKWQNVHSHEAHFRDTAHGLLVWAVSTLAGVLIAASALAPPAAEMATSAATTVAQGMTDAASATPAAVAADPAALRRQAERAKNVAAQFSLFMGIGLLLSAFVASVAAAIGGLRREEMHTAYWSEHTGLPRS